MKVPLTPLALEMLTASGKPCLSTTRLILTPLTFLPPSMPRLPQVGAERHDRLSTTTTEGFGLSPQAIRQLRSRSSISAFHSPSRCQRAKQEYTVPNGRPARRHTVRHCMPQ